MNLTRNLQYILFSIMLAVLVGSCGSTHGKAINDYDGVREAVTNKVFEIQHQWALPMGGGMIDLTGNPNFIRFNKDSVDLFLPYFGVRHAGGGYNPAEGGLTYKGEIKNLEIKEEGNKKFQIKFDGQQDQDQLRFTINIYGNGSTNTSVLMAQRQTISYRGFLRELPEEFR